MNWEKAAQKDLPELIRLLCKKEWENMHFSSRIYNAGKPRIPSRKGSVYVIRGLGGSMKGALMFWDKCQIFPCFPDEEPTHPELEELAILMNREVPRLFSLIGSGRVTNLLLPYLEKKPKDLIQYRMMLLNHPLMPSLNVQQKIRPALSSDLSSLLPMEVAYQKEEVLRNPDYINLPYVKKLFLKQLKEQLVVFGSLKGKPVSRAATNARGFHYDQLGGIFTWKEHRSRGYGTECLSFLLGLIEEDQRHSCLFVKEENTAALRLYEKTGFEDRGTFRIAYFF